ncbi:hypothetical protein E0Z10_g9396 [Xylaria hypoxylon]|uniref:RNase III domain-containing protein n=1 Tax=Xylaria hypoxylon TaxID=37992 RepID=A0A4Z0YHC3_9PEZI|nr:hypothetical protein E0Z10_g9396 [Xylaria hypoxylon]
MALNTSRSTVSVSLQALRHYRGQNVCSVATPLASTSSRTFATSPSRLSESAAEAPRWSYTPEQMKAPFSPHIIMDPTRSRWHVNADPKKLDDALRSFFGRDGDRLLPEELKWLAVTHKSFDQGRRGFNDRLAFLGRQICVREAMESIITSPPKYNNIAADTYAEKRQPFEDPALRSLDNLSGDQPSDIFTLERLTKLAVDTGLSEVVRWKPRMPENQVGSGLNTVMCGAVYSLVGAVALQNGGKAASRIEAETSQMARFQINLPLVHQVPIQYVLIIPVLISVLATLTLTIHGDVNIPLLYSQCHARSRLPEISHIPVLGAPACFLVSTFMFATASMHGIAQLSVVLAFLGALLTVCRVEAARACNRLSWNIHFPTLSWLVFNLVGGTFVWDLWIVPAFLKHAKDVRVQRIKRDALETQQPSGNLFDDEEQVMLERSFNTKAEVYAIPIAVAIGFIVPSVLMLTLKDAASIIVWLLFPLWVAIVHWVVKFAAVKLITDNGPLYLESHPLSVALVYALPFVASLLAHAFLIWNLFCKDDSRRMTLTALNFIKIDFAFIAATVLYWVFVESGIVPAVVMVVFSVFLGPGAALCLTWLVREKAICTFANSGEEYESDNETDGDDSTVHEDTPLLN